MMKTKKIDLKGMRDDQVMLLLQCWKDQHCKATPASEMFSEKMLEHGEGVYMTREQVYPTIEEAFERGYLRIAPPYNHALAQRIIDRYGSNVAGERFRVSDVRVSTSRRNLQYVASNGADVVMELIDLLAATKDTVHVGIGAGTTSMYFARSLAQAVRGKKEVLPRLAIHALTSGMDALAPERSPESFFGMFSQCGMKPEMVGMPAPPFVASNQYQQTLKNPAVKVAFEKKHEIDIVVTALASVHDEHGCMRSLIDYQGGESPSWMTRSRVIGDIQYRPFSEKGPVLERGSLRAITLFELAELREMVQQDGKYVVLIAGPCDVCGKTREAALKPVMVNDDLKVWSHLVCDLDTAEGLVAPWRP